MNASTFWFLAVGGSAALTHLAIFALAQSRMLPELANALGFVVAFFVSFAGHRYLSFKATRTPVATSLGRFALTALAGFASNEFIFSMLWRVLDLPTLLALGIALVLAAGQTFWLSRFWAFRR